MKKIFLASVVLSSMSFFACSDDSSSDAPENGEATCEVLSDKADFFEVKLAKIGEFTSIEKYEYKDGEVTITSVKELDKSASEEDVKAACENAEGSENSEITCSGNTVKVVEKEEIDSEKFKTEVEKIKDSCEEIQESGKLPNEDDDEDSYEEHKRHTEASCLSKDDPTAKISYVFDNSTLTRTLLPFIDNNVDAVCKAAKESAAANEDVKCSETAVEIISEFENQTIEDFTAMYKSECMAKN